MSSADGVAGPIGAPRPSDPGLAGERTSLAWARMGLTLLGLPGAVLAYATGRSMLDAVITAAAAGVLGLGVLTTSVRRQRASPDMLSTGDLTPSVRQVLLTAACVLLLCASGLILVLE